MTPQEILSGLEAQSPGTTDALRRLRSGQGTQADIDGLTLLVLNEFRERTQLQSGVRALIKMVPRHGAPAYPALGPPATVLVKRLCELGGIEYVPTYTDV